MDPPPTKTTKPLRKREMRKTDRRQASAAARALLEPLCKEGPYRDLALADKLRLQRETGMTERKIIYFMQNHRSRDAKRARAARDICSSDSIQTSNGNYTPSDDSTRLDGRTPEESELVDQVYHPAGVAASPPSLLSQPSTALQQPVEHETVQQQWHEQNAHSYYTTSSISSHAGPSSRPAIRFPSAPYSTLDLTTYVSPLNDSFSASTPAPPTSHPKPSFDYNQSRSSAPQYFPPAEVLHYPHYRATKDRDSFPPPPSGALRVGHYPLVTTDHYPTPGWYGPQPEQIYRWAQASAE